MSSLVYQQPGSKKQVYRHFECLVQRHLIFFLLRGTKAFGGSCIASKLRSPILRLQGQNGELALMNHLVGKMINFRKSKIPNHPRNSQSLLLQINQRGPIKFFIYKEGSHKSTTSFQNKRDVKSDTNVETSQASPKTIY